MIVISPSHLTCALLISYHFLSSFGVINEMVETFLEGMSLSEAMAAKKIYKCDLKVLEGIEGRGDLKVSLPPTI